MPDDDFQEREAALRRAMENYVPSGVKAQLRRLLPIIKTMRARRMKWREIAVELNIKWATGVLVQGRALCNLCIQLEDEIPASTILPVDQPLQSAYSQNQGQLRNAAPVGVDNTGGERGNAGQQQVPDSQQLTAQTGRSGGSRDVYGDEDRRLGTAAKIPPLDRPQTVARLRGLETQLAPAQSGSEGPTSFGPVMDRPSEPTPVWPPAEPTSGGDKQPFEIRIGGGERAPKPKVEVELPSMRRSRARI